MRYGTGAGEMEVGPERRGNYPAHGPA
jgi:hypothetical protein